MKSKYSHTALRKVSQVAMLGVFISLLFTSSGHSLVASVPQSNPDLSGNWESKYKPDSNWADAFVTQEGQSLTFHNERGGKSKGRFVSPNEVVADEWENGLRAKVADGGNRLEWANGSVWRRKAAPLAGNWESKYKPDSNWADASVTQEGQSLTFHNERGGKSKGRFVGSNEVVADEWENGLRARVTDGGNRLEWANGSVWRRKETSLAGNWESDYKKGEWKPTTIRQEGSKLWFTNEFGDTSEGVYESQTRVKATKWEGGLGATIENSNSIRWDNGTLWRRR